MDRRSFMRWFSGMVPAAVLTTLAGRADRAEAGHVEFRVSDPRYRKIGSNRWVVVDPHRNNRRVSMVKGDPGERPFAECQMAGYDVEIYLDGEPQDGVLTADEAECMIVRYARAPGGERWLINPITDEIVQETVYGDVEIRYVPRSDCEPG